MSKTKKSVLVIEDSHYLAESLKDMLEISGHNPIIASNGKEGAELAIAKQPDLVLLDIRLPDIDGYEVFRRIRADKWGKNANILILTASESIENISKNINLPTDRVLFKPEWSIPELSKKINSLIE